MSENATVIDVSKLNALMEKFLGRVPCDKWQRMTDCQAEAFLGQGEPVFVQPQDCEHGDNCYPVGRPRNFVESMGLAWLVRDRLAEMFPTAYSAVGEYEFLSRRQWMFHFWDGDETYLTADAETPMLAICQVAEKVMRDEDATDAD